MLKSNLRKNQTAIRIVKFLKFLKIDSYLISLSLQGSPKYCPFLRVALPDDTARRHRSAFPPDCKESLESLHPPAYQSVRRCKGETGHQTSQILSCRTRSAEQKRVWSIAQQNMAILPFDFSRSCSAFGRRGCRRPACHTQAARQRMKSG